MTVPACVRCTLWDRSASPRATLFLVRGAQGIALIEGRAYVLPEDVQEVWLPALRHRVQLDPATEVEGLIADEALGHTLQSIAMPR